MSAKLSIQERLAALKRAGEEDWKKRKHTSVLDEELLSCTMDKSPENNDNSIDKPANKVSPKPKSICDKIKDLQIDAAENWRKRIPHITDNNDAAKFTIASKIDEKLKANLTDNIQTYMSPDKVFNRNSVKYSSSASSSTISDASTKTDDNNDEQQQYDLKREKHMPSYQRVLFNKGVELIKHPGRVHSLCKLPN
jgi:hypothetical protein